MGDTQTRWDIKSGVCPYGHPLWKCHKLKLKRGKLTHACRIQMAEWAKIYRAGKRATSKPLNAMLSKPGPVVNHEKQTENCKLTLVCGHTTLYTRRSIEANEISYPGDLWCERCVEWKHVHSASNLRVDKPSWIYFELEVSER